MNKLLKSLPEDARKKLKKKKQPSWTAPMLATLTDERFSDPDWIFERKLDGERVLVFRQGNRVRLLSRNRKLLNNTYPELVDAYRNQPDGSFIVDGEVVAFQGRITSFSRLQGRMKLTDPEEARKAASRFTITFSTCCFSTATPSRSCRCATEKCCCARRSSFMGRFVSARIAAEKEKNFTRKHVKLALKE